jgi:hypothetical protein
MEDVHICGLESSSVSRISDSRGAMENQMKNAMNKPNQEQWNARICGRANEHNLISVALSS